MYMHEAQKGDLYKSADWATGRLICKSQSKLDAALKFMMFNQNKACWYMEAPAQKFQ